jgi:pyruvate dehydrogenase E1 component alpha subunit
VKSLKAADPIGRFEQTIIAKGLVSRAQLDKERETAVKAVDEAIEFARKSPYPESEEALEQVFA